MKSVNTNDLNGCIYNVRKMKKSMQLLASMCRPVVFVHFVPSRFFASNADFNLLII
jgi:hypothetical protein